MSSSSSTEPMPTTRRIVTGHTPNGRAAITSDTILRPANPLLPNNTPPTGIIPGFTTIARTNGIPADATSPFIDPHGTKIPLTDASGVVCRIVDFPPTPEKEVREGDEVNIMHRTQSVDFGVVLKGEILMVLDDGVQTLCKEGDVVVQRGTSHAWKNISTSNCRVLFVLVPAKKVKNETTGEILLPTPTPHLVD